MENLNFKNNNPGAVQYGNFINYYQFHPAEHRISLLPKNIWASFALETETSLFTVLDVGCNSGDLTIALYTFLTETVGIKNCNILGIDIDPTLIERASEKNIFNKNITFKCADITTNQCQQIIAQYLNERNTKLFHIVFCFSITMWIHLNHGDIGLYEFLKNISNLGEYIVIEPQPKKCYKNAIKRLKCSPFVHELDVNENIEDKIELFIIENCGLNKITESDRTKWKRKLLFFKRTLMKS